MRIPGVSNWATLLRPGVGTILHIRVRNVPRLTPPASLKRPAVPASRNPAQSAQVSARDAVFDKFLKQEPRQTRLIMPDDVVLLQKISGDTDETHAPEFLDG
jgi:hypothetical protein